VDAYLLTTHPGEPPWERVLETQEEPSSYLPIYLSTYLLTYTPPREREREHTLRGWRMGHPSILPSTHGGYYHLHGWRGGMVEVAW